VAFLFVCTPIVFRSFGAQSKVPGPRDGRPHDRAAFAAGGAYEIRFDVGPSQLCSSREQPFGLRRRPSSDCRRATSSFCAAQRPVSWRTAILRSLRNIGDTHNQNSAFAVAPVSTVLFARCFKGPPQSRYLFEGWAFGSVTGVATDSAGILATDCRRASNFSVSVAICLESFFVSAC
jgi:hypothetical protein